MSIIFTPDETRQLVLEALDLEQRLSRLGASDQVQRIRAVAIRRRQRRLDRYRRSLHPVQVNFKFEDLHILLTEEEEEQP